MRLKGFLATILLSFLSSSTLISAAPESGSTTYRKFVIYYGWCSDSRGELGHDIERIIAAKPEFVISPYYTSDGNVNLKPKVIDMLHESGIKVVVYSATGNGNRGLEGLLKEIKTGIDNGADGVFLDEVAMLHSSREVEYYKKIYDYVKSFGSELLVIANPGSILVNEKVMSVSDMVSFEHQWKLASHIDWFSRYPATRFMGISSNDITNVMGYKVDENAAARDSIEAWQGGIGYHYSTNSYTTLPTWFEEYQKGLEDFAISGTKLQELVVKTTDSDGNEIKGFWIEVKKGGRTVITGFSPAKFLLPEGTYDVGASSYQNFVFSRWQDGESAPYHTVTLANTTALVAVYKSEVANLRIESYDSLGNSIKGMHVKVSGNAGIASQGSTPLNLRLPLGNYSITASDYEYYKFTNWENGTQFRQVQLKDNTIIAAYYNNTLADRLGPEIFTCNDYRQQVANSMTESGPLAVLLELQLKNALTHTGCS